MNKLELRNIDFGYTTNLIYSDFSITFNAGDKIGILGANGCGKTTLVNIITGFNKPQKGSILIDNNEYKLENNNLRKLIGLVPQEYALLEELTPIENLKFFAKINKVPKEQLQLKIEEMLDISQLQMHKNMKVKNFSGGMKRRLNLVIALITNPEIILLDEPTVGVDPQSRDYILEQLNVIEMKNKVLFYVSHYMKEIERTCNKVLILDQGKILMYDEILNIKNRISDNKVIVKGIASSNTHKFKHNIQENTTQFYGFKNIDEATSFARENGFKIISYAEETLEEIFIKVTGKNLRD